MDSFMNLAKQGYEAYKDSQENVSHQGGQSGGNVQGGSEYNRPAHEQYSGQQGGPSFDEGDAVQHAVSHADNSGDASLFSSAMGFLKNNSHATHGDIDEDGAVQAHQAAYSKGQASNMSAESMGSAAAMQALKMFTSGQSSAGGGSSSGLIGLAMSQASKLFDQSNGPSSGGKQDVVNSAATMMMKLIAKKEMSQFTGGGNSGGLDMLTGLAGKLL